MLKSKKLKGAISAGLFVFIGVFYQNCAAPLDNQSSGTVESASTDEVASLGSHDRFAYNVSVDTFAYMSCHPSGLSQDLGNDRMLFTFKLGAYTSTKGLGLSSSFYDKTDHYSEELFREKMNQDPLNGPAVLQMSIRQSSDLTKFSQYAGGIVGLPLSRLASHDDVAGDLRKRPKGGVVNYFKDITGLDGRHVYSALNGVHRSRQRMNELMSDLQSGSMLVMSFVDALNGDPKEDAPILKMDNKGSAAYGGVGFHIEGNNRKISALREYNLKAPNSKVKTWGCSDEYKFMIVANRDYQLDIQDPEKVASQHICPWVTDNEQVSNKQILQRVRKILDPSHGLWMINVAKKCIVPKMNSGCYESTAFSENGKIKISYDSPNNCADDALCPQYLNVCIRD